MIKVWPWISFVRRFVLLYSWCHLKECDTNSQTNHIQWLIITAQICDWREIFKKWQNRYFNTYCITLEWYNMKVCDNVYVTTLPTLLTFLFLKLNHSFINSFLLDSFDICSFSFHNNMLQLMNFSLMKMVDFVV